MVKQKKENSISFLQKAVRNPKNIQGTHIFVQRNISRDPEQQKCHISFFRTISNIVAEILSYHAAFSLFIKRQKF